MGLLDGKVALITGAGRGQGRSHAERLAGEGADIVAIDMCRDLDTVPYELATEEDLDETVARVEKLGRRALKVVADVRDLAALRQAVTRTMEELGRLDIVVANAGVTSWIGDGHDDTAEQVWQDVIDIDLTGVWHTLRATVPTMILAGKGGSIVITSSTAGLKGFGGGAAGSEAYGAAKHGVIGLMKTYATMLAPHMIRVNTVHPTGVATKMVQNPEFEKIFELMGDAARDSLRNPMPVELVEPQDVSEAVLWLVSDAARYITGVQLPVDAGYMVR